MTFFCLFLVWRFQFYCNFMHSSSSFKLKKSHRLEIVMSVLCLRRENGKKRAWCWAVENLASSDRSEDILNFFFGWVGWDRFTSGSLICAMTTVITIIITIKTIYSQTTTPNMLGERRNVWTWTQWTMEEFSGWKGETGELDGCRVNGIWNSNRLAER